MEGFVQRVNVSGLLGDGVFQGDFPFPGFHVSRALRRVLGVGLEGHGAGHVRRRFLLHAAGGQGEMHPIQSIRLVVVDFHVGPQAVAEHHVVLLHAADDGVQVGSGASVGQRAPL